MKTMVSISRDRKIQRATPHPPVSTVISSALLLIESAAVQQHVPQVVKININLQQHAVRRPVLFIRSRIPVGKEIEEPG
jgi:hypothetical protein